MSARAESKAQLANPGSRQKRCCQGLVDYVAKRLQPKPPAGTVQRLPGMRATLREAKASGRRLQMGHMIPRHQSRLVIATVTWTVQDHLSGANAVSGKLRRALLVESAMDLLPLAQALTWRVEADHEVHPGLGLFA